LTFQACLVKIECRKRKEERRERMSKAESEEKKEKEKREGSGGRICSSEPFFYLWQRAKIKN